MWLHHHARYVCKTWAAIIDTFHFAQLQHDRACYSKPPGLYLSNSMLPNTSYFMDSVNGQFVRNDLVTPLTKGTYLISTCDGIMFCNCNYLREYFVVNPILNCSFTIPPLPSLNGISGFLEFTLIRVPHTAKFKIFFAHSNFLYGLTIGIGNSWKEIVGGKIEPRMRMWKPVYSGSNNLYWPTMEAVIVIDIYKEIIVGEYPLPYNYALNYPSPKYLWMGNCLSSIVGTNHDTSFKIYVLDIDSRRWSLHREIGTFDYVAAYGHELTITTMSFCFWMEDQIVFKIDVDEARTTPIDPSTTIFFGYNINTRQLTKIEAIADAGEGFWIAWRHTNSLISLPSNHA
ncbi:PREDICTED: uncharacterized protein LOC109326124 [Lupinus angustifolius]|nr:PREDICTED: uncharacterized protein LOC109326124 [Lupinus angustifolius]